MGGNAFDDLQKLTPEQYQSITKELLDLISPMCEKIEPYIPLPEKKVHGDIDFLLVFKQGFSLTNIIELMKLQKGQYIINHNMTANTVYRNKQIDFNITADLHEFEMCRFYKSYGGVGAFLGLLLPSKLVKYSQHGLFCCWYYEHLKLEFRVCSDVKQIMNFYGLDSQAYFKGFSDRQKLFQFLLQAKYLNPEEFKSKKPKWITKLIKSFQEYLLDHPEITNPHCERPEDPISMTLKHFDKEKQFEQAWKEKVREEEKKQHRSQKWNGKHIIDIFGVPTKEVNGLKRKFESCFASKEEQELFIDSHSLQEIVGYFSKVCLIEPISELKP